MGSLNAVPLPLLFFLVSFFLLLHAESVQIERRTYVVQMDTSLMPKAFSSHDNWYNSTLDSLKSANLASFGGHTSPLSLIYTYNHALHGFSVFLSLEELEVLKKSPGFISAYRDKILTLDSTHTHEFLSLNPSTGLWPNSNFGEDVIVGVMDSGIWPEHESFKDEGMSTKVPSRWKGKCEGGQGFNSSLCNYKLIGVRYFNEGFKKESPNKISCTNSARDVEGHGTFVASIVAGNYVSNVSFFGYAKGTATGIAPRARLAIYKAVWSGKVSLSDLVAGIDEAIADGVDVLSISFGMDDMTLESNPIAVASFRAMKKGVLISASAGNDGPTLWTVHNEFPWVLTVTAGSVDRWFAGYLTLGNGKTIVGWTMYPSNASLQNLPLVYNVSLAACDKKIMSENINGIIVCDQAGSLSSQMVYITASSVQGAVLIADNPNFFEVGGPYCACVVITSKEAPLVISYTKTHGTPVASITFQHTIMGIKPAPIVASYASRGPSLRFPTILKPDIMAPGSLVLGGWTPESPMGHLGLSLKYSDYNIRHGTSFACPHITGVIALLKGMHPNWSPAAIKSAIMTTAIPFDNTANPIRDNGNRLQFASPLAMGAGQVRPNQALDPGLIYDLTTQDYVNLLCSMNLNMTQIRVIAGSDCNCENPSSDLNYPSFIVFYCGRGMLRDQEFHRILTNVGEGAATYNALVRAPKDSIVTISPMRLVFKKKYDRQSFKLTVSYKGYEDSRVSFGDLIWIEENGNREVRSPIVVSPVVNKADNTSCQT